MATREEFIQAVGNATDAVDFETQVLTIGRSLLPECAIAVLDGGEDTPEYWDWLISQFDSPMRYM